MPSNKRLNKKATNIMFIIYINASENRYPVFRISGCFVFKTSAVNIRCRLKLKPIKKKYIVLRLGMFKNSGSRKYRKDIISV